MYLSLSLLLMRRVVHFNSLSAERRDEQSNILMRDHLTVLGYVDYIFQAVWHRITKYVREVGNPFQ